MYPLHRSLYNIAKPELIKKKNKTNNNDNKINKRNTI